MIEEKDLVDFKKATEQQKRKVADIMIANYTRMVEEFVREADYATTTGYWKDFTPQTFNQMSASEFITKYGHIIGEPIEIRERKNMELKGFIMPGDKVSVTCCENIEDIEIGGVSLYEKLTELFNQSEEDYWNDSSKQSPRYHVRYVILEQAPSEEKSFDQQSAEVVASMLYADLISGCYSEWTCGYGGFDYVADENGHSIFKELRSHVGKYVHFVI